MQGGVPFSVADTDIEEAIVALHGNLAAVAKKFAVSRSTIYKRIGETPTLQEALTDARESMIDHAESILQKNVLNGMETSLIFFLKTQGYKRGYGRQGNYDPDQAEDVNRPATVADIDAAIAKVAASERSTV